MKIKLYCSDGVVGRSYYMTLNGVKVDIVTNCGDYEQAKTKTLEIIEKLGLYYPHQIKFEHDGWM